MPTLKYLDGTYECATAIKGSDYIHLLDESGVMIVAFDEIKDFSKFTLTNGSYTSPTSDHDCYLAVFRDDGTLGRGGHKCSDIPMTAADVGAIPIIAATSADYDMDTIIKSGPHFGAYRTGANTLGTPYKYGLVTFQSAVIYSFAASTSNGVQIACVAGRTRPIIRSLSSGKLGEWSEIALHGQVVNKSGDTMTGDLTISRATPKITLSETSSGSELVLRQNNTNQTVFENINVAGASANKRQFVLSNSGKEELNKALRLADIVNGSVGWYDILHTANLSANNIGQIVTGSYVGTGTWGEANPNSLTFDRPPKFLALCEANGIVTFNNTNGNIMKYMGMTDALTTEYQTNVWMQVQSSSGWGLTGHAKCSEDRKTISWYVSNQSELSEDQMLGAQRNTSGVTYRYFAIL